MSVFLCKCTNTKHPKCVEKTKGKHTKFVLCKSNFSLEREKKKKTHQTTKTRDVSQCGLAIYIKKYLKAKEELWNLKYFTTQKYSLQNIL